MVENSKTSKRCKEEEKMRQDRLRNDSLGDRELRKIKIFRISYAKNI